jgi:hypothetical protein
MYQSLEWSDLRTVQRNQIGVQPAFATFDLSLGGRHEGSSLELYLTNAFDRRGQIFRYSSCGGCSSVATYAVPTQPRTIGIKFGQNF